MSDGGKGSSRRPTFVDEKTLSDNWDKIFGKKNKPIEESDVTKKEVSKQDQR